MEFREDGRIEASYERTHDIAMAMMEAVRDETLGYAILGCGLALARLHNPERELRREEEEAFIQDLNEFVGLYWDTKGAVKH